jgi:hypothetical protein
MRRPFGHTLEGIPRRVLTPQEWEVVDAGEDMRWVLTPSEWREVERFKALGKLRPVGGGDFATACVLARASVVDGTGVTGLTETIASASPLYAGSGASTLGSGGFWYQGRSLRFWCWGRLNTGASASTMTLNMHLDTTGGASLGASAAVSIVVSQTNISFFVKYNVTCRTIGAAGTLFGMGALEANPAVIASTNQPVMMPASVPTTATIDTTVNHQLVFTAVFSATGHTLTPHIEHWETLN